VRVAVIDLGTNTFNLSVSEKRGTGYVNICSAKEGVGLGMGGINQNRITDDAMQRGLETLRKFRKTAGENEAEEIVLIGTSALRNATNSVDFVNRVWKELSLKIHIISGEEEARLIYLGVSSGITFDTPGLIMDIGGGSTEFILADSKGPLRSRSFEIGVSRIFQAFPFNDPLVDENVAEVEKYLEKSCGNFFVGMQVEWLVGASGTFETFYELCFNERYPAGKTLTMPAAEVLPQLDYLIHSSVAERERNEWIIPIRKKMAPVAAVKTRWIFRTLGIQKLTISPFSLKEGVLIEFDNYVE